MDTPKDDDNALVQSHLDWTSKQGRILTANGRANEFYTAARGFPFLEQELPHFHLLQGDTSFSSIFNGDMKSPIVGAWSRDFFVGGWDFSSDKDETVYNVQTNSLFIDLRIPKSRNQVLRNVTSLQEYTNLELRLYARQHVFCGISVVESIHERNVCTRHHVLDWNFVGVPRPRPNKWWIEFPSTSQRDVWKEWAFCTDDYNQHYYCEQWSRLLSSSSSSSSSESNVTVALRKECSDEENTEDGILVVVGNHFNYIRGRPLASCETEYPNATSLVELVDAALHVGDRTTALKWLGRIQAGHGRIHEQHNYAWKIDCAIEPWKQGSLLFQQGDVEVVQAEHATENVRDCTVLWNDERWNVFETSLQNVQQLRDLLEKGLLPS